MMRMALASPHDRIEGGPSGQGCGGMRRRLGTLAGTQLGGTRAGITRDLVVFGRHRAFGEDGKTRLSLRWLRLMPRATTRLGALVEEILDDAVFQRMKR